MSGGGSGSNIKPRMRNCQKGNFSAGKGHGGCAKVKRKK